MSDRPVIIIRRKKKGGHGHHGGAWKIAFADFMTALMALFLVLWTLASASDEHRIAVAEYFRTPLLVAMAGGDRDGASQSVIPGGGPDPTFAEGERARIDLRQEQRRIDELERKRLRELEERLEAAINIDPLLKDLRDQILVDLTPEGLRIQLVDTEQRPMFEIGSARVAPTCAPCCAPWRRCSTSCRTASRSPDTPTVCPMPAARRATATGSCRPTAPMPRAAS
ncbi:flagellar motor protein MotB [Azotobacter sp. CWF10]